MSEEFKPGDTVMLKSGGPLMTVKRTGHTGNKGAFVECLWFVDARVKEEEFPPAVLERATKQEVTKQEVADSQTSGRIVKPKR